jgi:hypothetical protein
MASKYVIFAGVREAVKQLLMGTAVTWWRSSHKYSWQPSSCIILHQLSSGILHLSQGSAPFCIRIRTAWDGPDPTGGQGVLYEGKLELMSSQAKKNSLFLHIMKEVIINIIKVRLPKGAAMSFKEIFNFLFTF